MLKNLRDCISNFQVHTGPDGRKCGLTSVSGPSRWCSGGNLSAACPSTRRQDGGPGEGRSRTRPAIAVPAGLSTRERGRCRSVAIRRCPARLRQYTGDPVLPGSLTAPGPTSEGRGSHTDNRAWYSCDCQPCSARFEKGRRASGGLLLTTAGNSHHIGYVFSYRFRSRFGTFDGSVEFCLLDRPWRSRSRSAFC